MAIFEGSGVAIATPFMESGDVDWQALDNLIDWQIEEGTDSIVIVGTTGEASTLYDEEHIEVIEHTVKKVNSRVPVIAGVGSNHTEHGIKLSKEAERVGVDALLHVTPYYNKTSRTGLIDHMTAMADNVNIPILLYSVAGRTCMNIAPDVVAELAKHPNIVGIKEASGNIAQVVEISRITPGDFAIYSGNDDMVIPLLSVGGKGVISVLANVAPKVTHDMVMSFLNGDVKTACDLQLRYKPLIDALFIEVNPIPVKAALYMMGKCGYNYRMPLCRMADDTYKFLESEMRAAGLI
jgi:4-hydroxy-tetrahydrodipicolinate synthase